MSANEQDELDRLFIQLGFSGKTMGMEWYEQAKSGIQVYIAQHTKEAALKARIDELKLMSQSEINPSIFYDVDYESIERRIAELAAPQQSKETK